jgi:hypothetical protein
MVGKKQKITTMIIITTNNDANDDKIESWPESLRPKRRFTKWSPGRAFHGS